MLLDPKDMIDAIAEVVGEQVRAATAPLVARIAELEARAPLKGEPGQDADPALVKQLVDAAVAAIPVPEAPAPLAPDMDAIGELVRETVERQVAALPPPQDGTSVTLDDVRPLIDEAVAAIPVPRDGADADPALVKQLVDEAVAAIPVPEAPAPLAPDMDAIGEMLDGKVKSAVEALPPPKDGATAEELRPVVEDLVQRAVAALPAPKDGVGLAGAVIDRSGDLTLTMTDGAIHKLGCVVGRDADMPAIEAAAREMVAAIPVPKDGVDGIGFDDLSFDYDGSRTITLRFVRGERVKEFAVKVPMVLDAGVWRDDKTYEPGDGVTWGGSYWIAQKETTAKPDSGDGFRLAVKRGRDGKPADPVMLQTTPTKG